MYIWEYKLIRILKRIKFSRSIIYSSFETHKPDKDHWFHIPGNNNDEISTLSLVNLLNHFWTGRLGINITFKRRISFLLKSRIILACNLVSYDKYNFLNIQMLFPSIPITQILSSVYNS